MTWLSRALFLIGFLALSYSVGSVIDAELYQREMRHIFESIRKRCGAPWGMCPAQLI